MTKTISKKELYRNLKDVSDDVIQNGTTYTVIQYSKPAFQITPLDIMPKKKYQKTDIERFIIHEKSSKKTNLSTTYKQYLYS